MRAETLILELMADTSQLTRDINAAIDNAAKKVKGLEDSVITVKAPLKYLQDLNKELDLKERHIKQVANVAKSTPIVVGVDTRQVKAAKKELTDLRGEIGGSSTNKIFVKVEHEYKINARESNRDVSNSIQGLKGELKDIVKAVNSTKGGGLIRGIMSIPGTVVRGALMGFGQDVVKDFSVGFRREFNGIASSLFGSMEMAGTIFAKEIIDASKNMGGLTSFAVKQVKSIYDAVLEDFATASADEIEKELKERQEYFDKVERLNKQKIDAEQKLVNAQLSTNTRLIKQYQSLLSFIESSIESLNKKYGSVAPLTELESSFLSDPSVRKAYVSRKKQEFDILPSIQQEVMAYMDGEDIKQERLIAAQKKEDRKKQRQSQAGKGLRSFLNESLTDYRQKESDYNRRAARVAALEPDIQEKLNNASKLLLQKQNELKKLQGTDAYKADPTIFYDRELDLKKEIKQVENYITEGKTVLERNQQALTLAEKAYNKSKATLINAKRDFFGSVYQQENVSQLFQDATGKRPSDKNMPSVVDGTQWLKQNNAKAAYDPIRNQLMLTKEQIKAIQSSSLEANSELYQLILHEIIHALDFDMGSNKGIFARDRGSIARELPKITLNDAVRRYQDKGSLNDFLDFYRKERNYEQIRTSELSAEYQSRVITARKNGYELNSPLDAASVLTSKNTASLDSLKSVLLSQPSAITKDLLEKIDLLSEINQGYDKKIQDLIAEGEQSLFDVSDEDLQQFEGKTLSTLTDLGKLSQKTKDIIKEFQRRKGMYDKYTSPMLAIEKSLDDSFNNQDIGLLQKTRGEIAKQIKLLKKDSTIDPQVKKDLLQEYKELWVKSKNDLRLSDNPTVKDFLSSPIDSIKTVGEKAVIQMQDTAVDLVNGFADKVRDTTNAVLAAAQNPVPLLQGAGSGLVHSANQGVRAIAPAVAGAYGVVRGVENAALTVLPYGHLAKKAIQVGAVVGGVPLAAATIPALAPVAGMLGAAHSIGGAAGTALAAGHLGGVASIPLVGGQIATTLTSTASAIGGIVAEMGAAAIAVNAVAVGSKAIIDNALEDKTKAQMKALSPSVEEISKATQKAVQNQITNFGENYREARRIIGTGRGYNRRLGENIDKVVHLLPEEQKEPALKYAPVLATVEKAYAGDLDYQKKYKIPGLKGLDNKEFAKLPKFVQKTIQDEIVTIFNRVEQAKAEIDAQLSGLIGDDKKGILQDIQTGLGSKLTALQQKGIKLGIGAEKLKIDKLGSQSQAIDVNAVDLLDLAKLERTAIDHGRNMGKGATDGLSSTTPEAEKVTVEFAEEGFNKPFKKIQEINSPSELWKRFAKWMGLGSILGLKEIEPKVAKAAESVAKSASPKKYIDPRNLPTIPLPDTLDDEEKERIRHIESTNTKQVVFDAVKASVIKPPEIPLIAGIDEDITRKNIETELDLLSEQISSNSAVDFQLIGDVDVDEVIVGAIDAYNRADEAMQRMEKGNPFQDAKEKALTMFQSVKEQFPILDQIINKFKEIKNLIVNIGLAGAGAIGLFVIGKALTNIAVESVKVYRNFESIFIASKTIANGSEFLGKVRNQVKALGGDLETAMRQGQQFVTGLQGTTLERKAEDLFLGADQALKSLGLQTQQYDSAILAIKQVASKGRVSLEEISGQLGEAVPGALNIAAQAMQTNVQGFIQLVESGNLLSEEFLPKFVERLKAQTAFLQPEVEKSLNASFGRLAANYTDLQVGIGQSLSPTVATFVNTLSKGLEFINKNFDEVLLVVKTLAIALALPAAKMGLELAAKGVQALIANLIVADTAAKALSQSLAIAKAVGAGFIWAGAALAVTATIEGAFFLWQGGTQDIKDNTEALKNTVNSVADAYERAYQSANKIDKIQEGTGNWLLDAVDELIERTNQIDAWIAKTTGTKPSPGQTYAGARKEQDLSLLQEQSAEISLARFYQKKLTDSNEIDNYIKQALEIDNKMGLRRAEILAARAKDPVGNANLIKQLEKQIYDKGGLLEQREQLNERFVPGGIAAIEQAIKLTESAIFQAKRLGQTELVKKLNDDLSQMRLNLAKIQDVNNQITNGLNRQRLAYIDLNAEIAKRQEILQQQSISIDFPVLDKRIAGQLGDMQSSYLLAQNEVKRQQNNVNALIQDQKAREDFIANKLEISAKSSVRTLINKELADIDRGDISKLEALLANNQNSKQAIQDITGALTAFVEGKQNLLQAQKALRDAKIGMIQQSRTVEDFNRNLSYSIRDFNRGIESKNSEIRGIYRDWQRTLDDTVYDNQLTVRRLGEAYQDLMFNMESQLETSRNELLNLTDQINSEKRKQASLSITPGLDSYAKQLDGIFSQLFDSLTNGESEKRQANMEAVQTQKQYIDSLRQIRDIQEQEYQARKDQIRKIEDLSGQLKNITSQLKDWFVQEFQKRDDFIRTNKREGYDVTKQLAPAPNFANNQRSQAGTVQPMIIYQNGQTIRNLPAQNPVNNVVPFPSNSRPTIQNQAPVKPVDLGNIDSTNNDWQSYYWQQKIKEQLPPVPKVNHAIASNLNNQLQQRAKELQSLAKPSVIPTVSVSIPKKVQFGRASISHEELIALQQTAMRLGMPLATLLTIMLFETKGTLNPSIQNSKGATGLIQFMPATARRLGTTVNALKKMSFQEQLPYVEKYFKLHGWQAGMSDLEAYATVLGGNPRNINSKDSNGTNALSGMQRMNRQHRPIADNIMQHFGILSASPAFNFGIPESLEVGKTAGLLDDLGGFVSDKLNQFGNWKVNHRWMGKPKKQWDLYEVMRDYVINQGAENNIEGEVKDLHKQTSSMTKNFVNYLKLQVKQGQIDAKTVDAYIKQYEGLNKEVTQKVDKAKPKAQPKINRPLKAAEYLNVFFHAHGLDWNLINEGMVDALAKGQVGKKFKMPKGFPLQQQHFENYLKLPETEQARLLLEAQAKRRGKIDDPILVRERTAKTSPTATAPIIKQNESVTAIKEGVKEALSPAPMAIASITAQNFTPEKIVEFNPNLPKVPKLQEIPLSDYDALKERADAQKSVNESITNQKLILAQTKQDTAYLQAINDLQKMIYSLQDANRNKLRGAYDMRLEIASLVSNAKGYLTAAEQNFKVGSDMFRQIEDKRRQLADMRLDESRKQADWDKEKAILVERIESNDQLTLDQKQQAIQRIANLDTLIKESQELQKHHDIQLDILNADNNRMIQLARIKDAEIQRNNAIKEYADITASLATARYNLGGELINNGTVISAKMNALVNAYEFKEKLKTLNLSTAQMDEMVKMQKELSDINIAQSYVDAIPFLKEFSTGLKDAILQTTTWNDALKKLLDLVAGTILDQMVIKPIQLGIANILNDWGIFGNTEPINPPALDTNSGFSQAPFNEFGAVDYSGIVSGSQALAQSIQSVNTVIPDLGTAFVEQTLTTTQNTITEQTALLTFVSALTQASAAVLGFSASLGGRMFGAFNPVSEGLLSGFTGDTLMLPTFANGVDNAMKKERNLSGKSPFLAVLHEGEAVLSTLNGDAQLWRALKANGDWNHLKADNPKNFAFGSDVKPTRTTTVKSGDNVQISMVVNASNADSFRKSERRILSDMDAQIKRNRR